MRGAALTLLGAVAAALAGGDAPPSPSRSSGSWEILLASTATADEAFAAQELSGLLGNATGSAVPIVATKGSATLTLAVGYDAATSVGLAPSALDGFGNGAIFYWFSLFIYDCFATDLGPF